MSSYRIWQATGFQKWNAQQWANFLCCACPGAGKTTFGLEIARQVLNGGRVTRLVVVVPTMHLKTQWCDEAAKVGIQLDPGFLNSQAAGETSDFQGMCVTYAQVASEPQLHRALCRVPTLAIFDEVHHAAEQRSWGFGLREAFDGAIARLSLSGTPFREDGLRIPGIEYDMNGQCIAQINYGYRNALQDGVVRNIIFPTYEGEMTWWSGDVPGERGKEWSATFADEIPTVEESRRLQTALHPQGDWIRDVIKQADDQLQVIRRTVYASAAGLLIAQSQAHATQIATVMKAITGHDPVVVISEDSDADRKIEEFKRGGPTAPRWLIAVKMVSEGVDIRRLFVCVWATNTLTERFFLQVMGRIIRMIPDVDDQIAYLFIPSIERLIGYVERVKADREAAQRVISGDDEDQDSSGDGDPRTIPSGINNWSPYTSMAIENDTYIGDERFTPSEIAQARLISSRLSIQAGVELTALIMRQCREAGITVTVPPLQAPTQVDRVEKVAEKRRALRRQIQGRMSVYVHARIDRGLEFDEQEARKTAYYTLSQIQGVKQESATIEQLKARIEMLSSWIDEVRTVHA